MESFILKKDVNFLDIEEAFSVILNNPDIRLRLPNSLKERGVFGVEPLVLLLLATWIRRGGEKRIFHSYANSDEGFEDICSSFYGICALRFAREIWAEKNGNVVDKTIALGSAYGSFKKVVQGDFSRAFKGGYLAIPSIKAIGKNSEFISPLYNGSEVVDEDQFRFLVKKAIDAVIPQAGRKEILNDSILGNIASICRELFTNTHKHARTDSKSNILEENFRVIIFNSIELSKERITTLMKSGGAEIALFGAEWVADKSDWLYDDGKIVVLDISVIDSGPGYAKRWIKNFDSDLVPFNQEAEAIVNCFTKHKTSDDKESAGSGLTNVLADLKKLKGWFRLRTGGSLVERSFLFSDASIEINIKDIKKKEASIEGVSFNFLIPLKRLQG